MHCRFFIDYSKRMQALEYDGRYKRRRPHPLEPCESSILTLQSKQFFNGSGMVEDGIYAQGIAKRCGVKGRRQGNRIFASGLYGLRQGFSHHIHNGDFFHEGGRAGNIHKCSTKFGFQ
jgi:hypothetical protein